MKNPRILIVTPEITYLPEGMGNLAGKITFLVEHGKPVTKGQPVASIA